MRSPRLPHALLASLTLALLPTSARADGPAEEPGVLAEALFLADTLPPGAHAVTTWFGLERDAGGIVGLTPRLQIATPLDDRIGLTVDAGLLANGRLESPCASLKVGLRDAAADATGLAASLDVHGSPTPDVDGEVALVLGALRPAGDRLSLRATALVATGVSSFTPHAQLGGSAILALGRRVAVFAEVLADAGHGRLALSGGPAVRVDLGVASLLAGALLDAAHPELPLFAFQLTRSL